MSVPLICKISILVFDVKLDEEVDRAVVPGVAHRYLIGWLNTIGIVGFIAGFMY
jgi:hypothetical protein